jgi:hypothetical protein
MIYLTREETRPTMNKYGAQIRTRWERTAPQRLAQLQDPETYFTELGEMVGTQVARLSTTLAGAETPGETYLQKVGRLTAATRQAEELVMSELDWPAIELPVDEERLEWESNQPDESSLLEWAIYQGGAAQWDMILHMAETWMLPETFFEELAATETPSTYLAEHSEDLELAKEARFQKYLRSR